MKLSTTQAAAIAGVTDVTITRWIASGKLRARKIGGRWLVDARSLDGLKRGKPGRRPAEAATIARSQKGSKLHAVRKGVSLCGMRCEWVEAPHVNVLLEHVDSSGYSTYSTKKVRVTKPTCKRCTERLK